MALANNIGIKKSIKNCILISLGLSITIGFIFSINSSWIVKNCFHNKVGKSIVYLISVALPMISVSSCISGYFTAVGRVYKSIIANFLEYGAKIIITIFLLKRYLPDGNIENICFALVLGDVFSEVCSFTYNIFAFTFDINYHFIEPSKSKNSFLHRIFRILLPIGFTSYIRSGLSTLKQIIIPTSMKKSGIDSNVALAEYRNDYWYGSSDSYVSSVFFICSYRAFNS